MTISVLVNGQRPADLNHAVALNDRGLQYGDGLFETALVVQGAVRHFDAHLERLYQGCARLQIAPPDRDVLLSEVASLIKDIRHAVLKITITRGSGARGYRATGAHSATRIVALYAAPDVDPDRPIRLRWCETRLGRNARLAGIKHLNRLEQVLAQSEWDDPAIDEGLMLDTEGELVCGTASNVFIVRDGVLLTPDLRYCGVRGVMRAQVLRAAATMGAQVSEEPLWPADLESAQEVFITNAVRGIRSVAQLDSHRWQDTSFATALRGELR
jgi:4-amino-4-deoxychorismate lyase